ncbi:trans-aconitate 2-methyltransferase [Ramlibacter sp. WS9]|uniref:class I SAM-dependent methyltransferase n=1 Tax=Ramlibacter sp. WS9 TaxID=1882741 RepID=UPI0013052603|nr:class I SAM-dependent methyltransferase [Ramlibacter sp. WS9]
MNARAIPPGAIDDLDGVYQRTALYYSRKIAQFGPQPSGVDWRCEPTQQLRFVQLLKLCDSVGDFSLNDVGCGYGALLGYLARRRRLHRVDYLGIDIAPAMIEAARGAWPRHKKRFVAAASSPRTADYSVASGVFNVRLDVDLAVWERFVERTLRQMRETSSLGFAFNLMTPVPPTVDSPAELYRPAPDQWIAFCERELGAKVQTLTGYGLHEQTLLVRY